MAGSSVKARMRRFYLVGRLIPKALRGAPSALVGRHIAAPLRRRVAQAMRVVLVRQTRPVDIVFGRQAGNRFFWRSPTIPKTWDHVERRLLLLDARDRDCLDQFVALAVERSRDFVVLSNMARSSLTKSALAAQLASLDLSSGSDLARRIRSSHVFAAAIVGTSALLLEEPEAARIEAAVAALLPTLTEGYLSLIDSLGATPSRAPQSEFRRCLPASGFRDRKRHRLIIADNLADRQSMSLLFNGAENVTLYPLNDLYGRADFSDVSPHGSAEAITVEHSRTRITRFSADYHDLHDQTRRAAEKIIDRLGAILPDTPIIPRDSRPFAELVLADHLFFPTLLLAGVRKLIADREFDHIVIVLGTSRDDPEFSRLLAGLDEIRADARVEILSVSRRLSDRVNFAASLDILLGRPESPKPATYWGPPPEVVCGRLDAVCADIAPEVPSWPEGDGRRVLFISAPARAYNHSSRAYQEALAARNNLRVAFIGRNFLPLLQGQEQAAAPLSPSAIQLIPASLTKSQQRRFLSLKIWLLHFLAECVQDLDRDFAAHVLTQRSEYFATESLLALLVGFRAYGHWFGRMRTQGQLPDVVVMSPYRDAFVASFSALARSAGIPSIALEPHGLNANYCRYTNVLADYYGVITTFFRDEAAADFGISVERCHVVGSPRLTAPASYDLAARTAAARTDAAGHHGVDFGTAAMHLAFFTQPSNWTQMSAVWRSVVEATQGLDAVIFLKTHPEETASRVAQYLEICAELGATERVRIWQGDAKEAIECADLVLSGYSATVVEAAVLRRPVICVGNGDIDYPLDQHRVIGAPLVRSAAELAAALRDFAADPVPMRRHAAEFVQRERQLIEGLEVSLGRMLDDVLSTAPGEAIRNEAEVPTTCFLKGPHRTFEV